MRRLVRQGKRDPFIISAARSALDCAPEKNRRAELWALYGFVRASVRYTPDVNDAEMIQPADWVLKNGHGDCDDFTVLFCALAEAVGFATRIVAVGREVGTYQHVYAEVHFLGRQTGSTRDKLGWRSSKEMWVPVDCTMQHGPGWKPTGMQQRMEIRNGS